MREKSLLFRWYLYILRGKTVTRHDTQNRMIYQCSEKSGDRMEKLISTLALSSDITRP